MPDTSKTTYTLTGRVVDRSTGQGIANARVEGWDREAIVQEVVAVAFTDALGDFAWSLSREHLDGLFVDRSPALVLRAFDVATGQQLFGPEVLWKPSVRPAAVRVEVSTARFGPAKPAAHSVQGRVTDPAGQPVAQGTLVTAFNKKIRPPDQSVGTGNTDAQGRYRITYDVSTLQPAGKKAADLYVQTIISNFTYTSDVVCHAPPGAKIDLVTGDGKYRGPSEHQTVAAKVDALREGVLPKDLTDDDVKFVSCSGELPRAHVEGLRAAATLDDQSTRVSQEVFYGLVRQGLPTTKAELHRRRPAEMRRALEAAIAANEISDLTATLDTIIADLVEDGVDFAAVAQPPDNYSLDGLLVVPNLAVNDRKTFLRRYIQHVGTVSDFWTSLATVPPFTDAALLGRVQRTTQLGALSRNFLPLVQELHNRFQAAQYTTLADLAKLVEADWLAIVQLQTVGAPAGIPGATTPDKQTNYARVLTRTMESAFPTRAMADRIQRQEGPTADIVKFFNANLGFDFATTRVAVYLAQNPNALSTVTDPVATRTRLEKTERLFKLLPRWEEIKPLYDAGLHSARQVKAMGRARFVAQYASVLDGTSRAGTIWDKAAYVSDAANALFAKYHAGLHSLPIFALPDLATQAGSPPAVVADWGTLFGGSVSYCACEHCRSVLSPAAYLVDLLQFLGRHESTISGRTAKEILIGDSGGSLPGRRRDLRYLELSCENTNTVLPYVDLVDEILERTVALTFDGTGHAWPAVIATAGQTPDLLATPERILPAATYDRAYQVLAGYVPPLIPPPPVPAAVHPFTLPFNLWSEEIHTYLGHLGVPQSRLLEVLRKDTPGQPADYADREAAMRLRLSKRDWEVLTGAAIADVSPQDYWGVSAATWTAWTTGPVPVAQPGGQPSFLLQSGLTFDQLRELLATALLAGAVSLTGSGGCNLDQRTLTGLDAARLGKIHRFLRLRLRTGLRITELDKAMIAFAATDVTPAFLQKLAVALDLRDDLQVPLLEVLSWWADIDTRWADEDVSANVAAAKEWGSSLWTQLLRNRSVLNPPDAVFDTILTGPPPPAPNDVLTAHTEALLAALGVSAADFALLVDDSAAKARTGLGALLLGAQVTVPNVSRAFRLVSFARAAGLSLAELLILRALANVNALKGDQGPDAVPADTWKLVDIVRQVRASGFRVAEIDYAVRHFEHETDPVAPPSGTDAQIVADVEAGISEILAETALEDENVPDPDGQRTRALLGDLVPGATPAERASRVDRLMEVLGITTSTSPPMPADSPTVIANALTGLVPDINDARDKLSAGAGFITVLEDRYKYAFVRLLDHVRRTRGDSHAKDVIADALGLEDQAVSFLLGTVLRGVTNAGKPAVYDFRPPPRVDWLTLSWIAGNNADRIKLVQRLFAVSVLARRFGMSAAEIEWIYLAAAPAPTWLSLDALPSEFSLTSPLADAQARFAAWRQLADLYAVRASLQAGPQALVELLQLAAPRPTGTAVSAATFFDALSERAGWSRDDIATLDGAGGFGFNYAPADTADYVDPGVPALVRLRESFKLLRALGASALEALAWAPVWEEPSPPAPLAPGVAEDVKRVVRAKYDDARWHEVARPLGDVARERQRAALVAWLVAKDPDPAIVTANDLYEKLLVDVEMSPCQLTSRIKLAVGSVQQFIQRCFLNLEPTEVQLGDEAAGEWRWLKSYRVWEANRKVFLWPENWIEPELRPDKTPFFEALEGQLLQSEITAETAEEAYRQYLARLDEVARLDVVAVFRQEEPAAGGSAAVDVLHVIARSPSPPHAYYYRRRLDGAEWTAWEKIDLDIEGDQLVAVVHNRRLHLFWAIVQEVPDPSEQQPEDGEPNVHWEVRLAWSSYRGGRWAQKRVAAGDPFRVWWASGSFALEKTRFWLATERPASGDLLVYCMLSVEHIDFSVPPVYEDWLLPLWHIRIGKLTLGCGDEVETEQFRDGFTWTTAAEAWTGSLAPFPFMRPWYTDSWNSYFRETEEHFGDATADDTFILQIEVEGTLQPVVVLNETPDRFRAVVSRDEADRLRERDLAFFADRRRTYFLDLRDVPPGWTTPSQAYPQVTASVDSDTSFGLSSALLEWANEPPASFVTASIDGERRFRVEPFYHPYVCDFTRQLERYGLDGLLRWEEQSVPPLQLASRDVSAEYVPNLDEAVLAFPKEDVDFSLEGAYAPYNWELFFHAPLLIAKRLHDNQRFAEARDWLHYVFDPTGAVKDFDNDAVPDPAPQRFWRVRPFYENEDLASIQTQLTALAGASSTVLEVHALFANDTAAAAAAAITAQIERWRRDPFSPHVIARMRPIAYQKMVVRFYIENLIAWGDQLFRRDTIESINEATQLYVMAADLLGPRPQLVREPATIIKKTYEQLEPDLDTFSNAILATESLVLPPGATAVSGTGAGAADSAPSLASLYFCIPHNEKMLGLWDLVADRLFKIRHCMTIEGIVRQLPLFEPPIDPAILVRAAAAGVDIASVLNDINASAPIYRFGVLLPKALELAGTVTGLGGALLAALEKRDGEALGRLRQTHEVGLLEAVRDVRERAVQEAKENLTALERSLAVVEERFQFYSKIPEQIPEEAAQERLSERALVLGTAADATQAVATALTLIPQFTIGTSGAFGSPVAHVGFGGQQLSTFVSVGAAVLRGDAANQAGRAAQAATRATYERRWDEWKLQERLADKERKQIEKQIEAARIRLEIAEKDLQNHERQTENAREVEAFLREKYTSQELYDWTVAQVAAVYFQAYNLAYDMARRAERAYQLERGERNQVFVTFGYWDSLKKGLLAGERLLLDLRRMEAAYLDSNRRELEITKHVSLAEQDPFKLLQLRETETCDLDVKEVDFDQDYLGHYMRRIKSVSLTVPCVTGPYDGVNCQLTLLRSKVRLNASLTGGYTLPDGDVRAQTDFAATQSIVTSSGQGDSGTFTLDFRDERFLPFEGAGADSRWRIALDRETNRFDVQTVKDVVLHLRYTARDGGPALKTAAWNTLNGSTPTAWRLLSLKGDFPEQWKLFTQPGTGATVQSASLALPPSRFRRILGSKKLKITQVDVFVKWNENLAVPQPSLPASLLIHLPPYTNPTGLTLGTQSATYGALLTGTKSGLSLLVGPADPLVTLALEVRATDSTAPTDWRVAAGGVLKPTAIEDVWFICKAEKQP